MHAAAEARPALLCPHHARCPHGLVVTTCPLPHPSVASLSRLLLVLPVVHGGTSPATPRGSRRSSVAQQTTRKRAASSFDPFVLRPTRTPSLVWRAGGRPAMRSDRGHLPPTRPARPATPQPYPASFNPIARPLRVGTPPRESLSLPAPRSLCRLLVGILPNVRGGFPPSPRPTTYSTVHRRARRHAVDDEPK